MPTPSLSAGDVFFEANPDYPDRREQGALTRGLIRRWTSLPVPNRSGSQTHLRGAPFLPCVYAIPVTR
jgi:hypothetical protein